jgi:tRNA A-37 threonylcarbamoyl transferase component Bud32
VQQSAALIVAELTGLTSPAVIAVSSKKKIITMRAIFMRKLHDA